MHRHSTEPARPGRARRRSGPRVARLARPVDRAGAMLKVLVAVTLVAVVAVYFATAADAHRNDESYLYLDVGDDNLSGTVQMPFPDVREVFGLELAGSEDEVSAEIAANLDLLQTYADDETTIGSGGEVWELSFSEDFRLLEEGDTSADGFNYVILPYVVELTSDEVPQLLDVGFTPFLEEIDDRNNIALIGNDWQRGVIDEEANELVIFTEGSPTGQIDLGNPSQWKNFDASVDLGIDHIKTGPDHIFFILVLLLPSVLILVSGVWKPAPRFTGSLIRVLLVATMFTVAHSITFTLAGLDILPLPPAKLTETLIALSIAIAALHNLKPILGHREWVIAFVFGLFHGMGFAGFVEDLDISRTTQLVSLLGRNVGIEIGQAVIVLITFPALYLLSRTRIYRSIFVGVSLLLAGVSSIWVVERTTESDFGINDTIDKIVEWPRSLYLCILGTALAAAFYAYERNNNRLVAPLRPGGPGVAADTDADDTPASEPEAEPVG